MHFIVLFLFVLILSPTQCSLFVFLNYLHSGLFFISSDFWLFLVLRSLCHLASLALPPPVCLPTAAWLLSSFSFSRFEANCRTEDYLCFAAFLTDVIFRMAGERFLESACSHVQCWLQGIIWMMPTINGYSSVCVLWNSFPYIFPCSFSWCVRLILFLILFFFPPCPSLSNHFCANEFAVRSGLAW